MRAAEFARARRPWAFRAGLGLCFVAIVATKRGDFLRAWREVRLVSGAGLALLVGVTAVTVLSRALVLRSALPPIAVRRAMLVSEASVASQNGIVGGGLVSPGLRFHMLRSFGLPGESIALSIIGTSVAAQYAVWLLALTCSLAAVVSGQHGALPGSVAAVATVVLTAVTVGGWLLLFRPAPGNFLADRIDSMLARLRRRVARVPDIALRSRVTHGRVAAVELVRTRGLRTLMLSIASQLALALVLVISLRVFHVDDHLVTVPEVLIAFALVRVAASLTPSPGGVGVTEAGLAHLLATAGGPTSKVLAAVLTYRACTYLLPIPLGAASVLLWRRRQLRLQTV